MDTSRKNLKAYRCFGGFMLFIGVFTNVLGLISTPATFLFNNIVSNTFIGNELFMLVSAVITIYTYYLGYRIFIKLHGIPLVTVRKVDKTRLLSCIISCVFALVTIRFVWHSYYAVLDRLPIMYDAQQETEIGIITIIYGVIAAPMAEEIVFRGWLLKLLKKYGSLPAILFTALGFGLMHGSIFQSFPAFIIGIVLGCIACEYDSIIPTIILHIATNAMSMAGFMDKEAGFITIFGIMALIWLFISILKGRKQLFSSEQWHSAGILAVCSLSFIVFIIFCLIMIRMSYTSLAIINHLWYTW